MKAYGGNGGITPRIFIFCTRWRGVVNLTSLPLYHLGKRPRYPLISMVSGPHKPVWTFRRREKYLAFAGNRVALYGLLSSEPMH